MQDWYKSSYSPSEEALIREVENAWKSPQFTDKIRFNTEASNIMKIQGIGFSKEITLYFSKLNMMDTIFTNEDGTINKWDKLLKQNGSGIMMYAKGGYA